MVLAINQASKNNFRTMRNPGLVLLSTLGVLCGLLARTDAFQPRRTHETPCRPPRRRSSTALGPVVGTEAPNPLSFTEQRRKFRRDFFTHDSWLRHRSKDRFIGTFLKIFESGVLGALAQEIYLGAWYECDTSVYCVLLGRRCLTRWVISSYC